MHHLRTAGGRHEVEFIIKTEGRILAVESKLGQSIDDTDVRHLHGLRE